MIPQALKHKILHNPYYKKCSRKEVFQDHQCQGRITFEHVWIYAGKQIQEEWAIIPLCEFSHSVGLYQDSGILDKEKNQFISIRRTREEDFRRYKNFNWRQYKQYLINKYDS